MQVCVSVHEGVSRCLSTLFFCSPHPPAPRNPCNIKDTVSYAKPGAAGHALLFRDHVVLKKDMKVRLRVCTQRATLYARACVRDGIIAVCACLAQQQQMAKNRTSLAAA